MIPSVQLVATTNGVPSATKQHIDVHSDDEFVLPITPNSSPMAVEQSSSIDSQLQQQSIVIDSEQQPQQQPQQQQQQPQQQMQQNSNSNYLQFDEHHLIIHEDILSTCFAHAETTSTPLKNFAQITAHDNINYTIIDNNGESTDSNIVDADAMASGHNVLMQVIDVPMMFCQSMTPPSQPHTILSDERLTVPNGDEFRNNTNNDNNNDNNNNRDNVDDDNDNNNDNVIDASKLVPFHQLSPIVANAVAATEYATTPINEMDVDASNGKDSAKMDSEDGDDEEDAEEEDEDAGGSSSEQELTNLGWLIDLKNVTNWSTDTAMSSTHKRHSNGTSNLGGSAISNCIIDDIDDDDGCIGPIITDRDLSEERFKKFTIQVKQSQINYAERESVYRMDPLEKPPFNYAQIIAMAMMDQGRMTLKDICRWIQEHFAYFRCNKNWNNSIRHNLSLHFCFTKIARDKFEKGKGGYWELSMNTAKSEKKRIRNRRKQRDDTGRFSNHHRHSRNHQQQLQQHRSKNGQNKQTSSKQSTHHANFKAAKSTSNHLPSTITDNSNANNGSECSSSISSIMGYVDDVQNHCSPQEISEEQQAVQIIQQSHHQQQQEQQDQMTAELLQHELINDIIVNDLVIIDGSCLQQTSASNEEIINCHFNKDGQLNENYYIEHCHESETVSEAAINESSNEVFIKGDIQLCGGDIITIPYTKSSQSHPQLLHSPGKLLAAQTQCAIESFHGENGCSGITDSHTANGHQMLNFHIGSNVIVEPMPYSLSHMDTVIDIEHEFSSLVNMPDPELTEDCFFDSW